MGCPLCGATDVRCYQAPPAVITRDLVGVLGEADTLADLELCAACLRGLMAGASTTELLEAGSPSAERADAP